MTDEEQTEAIAILDCHYDVFQMRAGKQGAARTLRISLMVDATSDEAEIGLASLCRGDQAEALAAIRALKKSGAQIDLDGPGDVFNITLATAGSKKSKQDALGVVYRIRVKNASEGVASALVFIRTTGYTEALGIWIHKKLGVDLSATFSLEQTEMDFDKPDAPAAKAGKKKAKKTGKRVDKNPNK